MKNIWVLSYPLSWAHTHFVGFVMSWLIFSLDLYFKNGYIDHSKGFVCLLLFIEFISFRNSLGFACVSFFNFIIILVNVYVGLPVAM